MYDYMQAYQGFYQKMEIIKVNGEAGAKAFRMAPNSSALLLDDTAPIVWLVTTDGAGYLTTIPYRIEEIKPEPPADWKAINERLSKLEEAFNGQSNLSKTSKKPTTPESNAN